MIREIEFLRRHMYSNGWMRTGPRLRRFAHAGDAAHDPQVKYLVQGLTTITDVDNDDSRRAAIDAALESLPSIRRFIRTYEGVPEQTPCCEQFE